MGRYPLNYLNTAAILVVAYVAVFIESTPGGLRRVLGTQIDVLPALMVYSGISGGIPTISTAAIFGGLCFDALSLNPLGITILPLFSVGLAVYLTRDLILRDQPYARLLLGTAASAIAPMLTVLLLWGGGYQPGIGWGSLWQWVVLAVSGGISTPVFFWVFEHLNAALAYSRASESTFRSDREIKRGRA